jgi:hypothetical protein
MYMIGDRRDTSRQHHKIGYELAHRARPTDTVAPQRHPQNGNDATRRRRRDIGGQGFSPRRGEGYNNDTQLCSIGGGRLFIKTLIKKYLVGDQFVYQPHV